MTIAVFHKHLDACASCARDPYCPDADEILRQVNKNQKRDKRKGNSGNVDRAHPWRNTKPSK